ncbi:MAG: HAD family hydrolase [Acaryochloris sp. RU_4_1]|nr:HAD family hydrolase [Acaryochloris sp. RU_4_1]NJR53918.1 HAD family hydrolase [Acaryochloris sp. CRU_2_0]
MNSLNQPEQIKFLIFDLDGVITSEQKYWNTARLTVWELITHPDYLGLTSYFGQTLTQPDRVLAAGQQIIDNAFIYELKRRAINSNWDLTYFVFCLHLAGILQQVQQHAPEQWSQLQDQFEGASPPQWQKLGQSLLGLPLDRHANEATIAHFWQQTTALTGTAVTEYIYRFYQEHLGMSLPQSHHGLWELCYQNFQAWYEGKKGFILPDDETVLDLGMIQATLQSLQAAQYTLAIATGRPRNEVLEPLSALGLLSYFDPGRIITYDDVLAAETQFGLAQHPVKLGKPHPFAVLKAIHGDEDPQVLCSDSFQQGDRTYAAYIGDAASDIVAAKRSGCLSIGVLTGFTATHAQEEQVQLFTELGCDCVIDSILALPQVLGIDKP